MNSETCKMCENTVVVEVVYSMNNKDVYGYTCECCDYVSISSDLEINSK